MQYPHKAAFHAKGQLTNLNNVSALHTHYQWDDDAAAAAGERFKCQYLRLSWSNRRKKKIKLRREGVQLEKDSLRCTNKEKYTRITCASPPGACRPLCQFLPHSSLTSPAPRWHLHLPTPPPSERDFSIDLGSPLPPRSPRPAPHGASGAPLAARRTNCPPPAQHTRAAWPPARGPPRHCPQPLLVPRPSPRLPSTHTGAHPRHHQPLRPLTMNLRAFSCSTASAGSIALRRRRGRSSSQCQAAASADRNLRCPRPPATPPRCPHSACATRRPTGNGVPGRATGKGPACGSELQSPKGLGARRTPGAGGRMRYPWARGPMGVVVAGSCDGASWGCWDIPARAGSPAPQRPCGLLPGSFQAAPGLPWRGTRLAPKSQPSAFPLQHLTCG